MARSSAVNLPLALLAAASLAGCGSTLLDHDADPSLLVLDCGPGSVSCNGECMACQPPPNGRPACVNGGCSFTCTAGYNRCPPAGDTCAPETGTSCGPSCADCTSSTPANASPACSAAHACTFACDPGYLKSGSGCQRAVAVSAGYVHTCALTADGRVKCWGANDSGQLGNGSTTDSATPVDAALPGAAQVIAAGYDHTCAVVSGAVYCWGDNAFGEIGDGTTTDRPNPVAVSALTTGIVAMGAGGGILNSTVSFGHTCAVDAAGGVHCWGANGSGQVGDGTTVTRTSPVAVTALPPGTAVASVACGERHTCANAFGTVFCWGADDSGQLGIGSTNAQTSPATAAVPSGASSVATGQAHSCAVVGSGLECWGLNGNGQVDAGNAATGAFLSPIAVPLGTILPSTVGTGRSHTCTADGATVPATPVCFGADNADQLGGPGPIDTVALLGPATTVLAITAGENHTCVLTGLGGVQCFGADDRGQLGNGTSGGVSAAPGYVSGL